MNGQNRFFFGEALCKSTGLLHWRVKEELPYLGEVLVFLDPRLMREYRRWVERTLSRIREKMN